ncbi:MAG TPA: NAD-glutamate dehydrogenase, partial [Hellea balneolensis]|nr:NAD-glutamate dehydrogenase [Hellea balneolensis]
MARLKFTKTAFVKSAIGDEAWYHDGEFEPGAEHFLKSYYHDAEQNDALALDKTELLALARAFWMDGQSRKIGKDVIKIRSPEGAGHLRGRYDLVEIITDDRRFLVDSVISEISSHGIDVLALFHPVVSGFRDEKGNWTKRGVEVRESMIQVLIAEQNSTSRKALKAGLKATLADLRAVIDDFKPMLTLLETSIDELVSMPGNVSTDVLDEATEFLEWIRDGNFVLLGTREYVYQHGAQKAKGGNGRSFDYVNPTMLKKSCYGVLRDMSKMVLRQSSEPAAISSNVEMFLKDKDPVTVAKSNLFSRVHRRVRMDYISVKKYSEDGTVKGETRFVGLFTVDAYARSPKFVPLIRRKVNQVLHRYGADPSSHNAKRMEFVLSSYPRDELFQSSEDDLFRIASGIAQAFDRPRTRIFVRKDPFKRFVSVLVFVPRENYNTRVRQQIGNRLKQAWDGRVSAFYPQYSDSPLARVHFIIGMDPDNTADPDIDALEADIAHITQPWSAGLIMAADARGNAEISERVSAYRNAFSPAYVSIFEVEEALEDVVEIEKLNDNNRLGVRVYEKAEDMDDVFRVKFYSLNQRLELSDIMPIFSNMALHVAQETGYKVKPDDGAADGVAGAEVWLHDYEMRLGFVPEDRTVLAAIFQDAFLAIMQGRNEDDGFNALILPQAVDWRRIALIRLLARYRTQSGMDPSESVQIAALAQYPEITGLLLAIF